VDGGVVETKLAVDGRRHHIHRTSRH
jgi:hypothetical protein